MTKSWDSYYEHYKDSLVDLSRYRLCISVKTESPQRNWVEQDVIEFLESLGYKLFEGETWMEAAIGQYSLGFSSIEDEGEEEIEVIDIFHQAPDNWFEEHEANDKDWISQNFGIPVDIIHEVFIDEMSESVI